MAVEPATRGRLIAASRNPAGTGGPDPPRVGSGSSPIATSRTCRARPSIPRCPPGRVVASACRLHLPGGIDPRVGWPRSSGGNSAPASKPLIRPEGLPDGPGGLRGGPQLGGEAEVGGRLGQRAEDDPSLPRGELGGLAGLPIISIVADTSGPECVATSPEARTPGTSRSWPPGSPPARSASRRPGTMSGARGRPVAAVDLGRMTAAARSGTMPGLAGHRGNLGRSSRRGRPHSIARHR